MLFSVLYCMSHLRIKQKMLFMKKKMRVRFLLHNVESEIEFGRSGASKTADLISKNL